MSVSSAPLPSLFEFMADGEPTDPASSASFSKPLALLSSSAAASSPLSLSFVSIESKKPRVEVKSRIRMLKRHRSRSPNQSRSTTTTTTTTTTAASSPPPPPMSSDQKQAYRRHDRKQQQQKQESAPPSHVLFCANLARETTKEKIAHVFSQFEEFGKVQNIDLLMDRRTGNHKGYCFVYFNDEDEARRLKNKLQNIVTPASSSIYIKQKKKNTNNQETTRPLTARKP